MPNNIIISSNKIRPLKRYNRYNLENNIEDSNMNFSEKDRQINMKLINKIDLKTLFDKNNNLFIQKIVNNLLSSKFYKSDFDEEYKYKIFISFQNALDYLVNKKNRLIKINNNLKTFFNETKKDSNDIEKKLVENKSIIERKSKIKNEKILIYEELKKKYEDMEKKKREIKNKQEENIKINNKLFIEKNIISDYLQKENSIFKDENKNQELIKNYCCKICSDKSFLNKNSLEVHLIKRHPYMIIKNSLKKKENSLDNKFSKKLKSMNEYFTNSFNYYKNKGKSNESLEEIIQKREENNIYFQNYLNNLEKNFEEMNTIIKNLSENQKIFINKFIIASGLKKSKKEIREDKKRKKEYLKHLEEAIKKSLVSDKLSLDLKAKIKELEEQLENYCLSQNSFKYDEIQNKKKNLSIIEEFPISNIKEEQKEIIDYEDKEQKIIEAIKNNSQKSILKNENKFSNNEELNELKESNNKKSIDKEKNESKDRNSNKHKNEEKKEEGEEVEEEEEKENEEEEEEEEEEKEEFSILSKNIKENQIEFDRIRDIKNSQIEKNKNNDLLILIDEIFGENKVNNLKNEQRKNKYKPEIISYEIPINSNKKDRVFQSELDEIIKGK